MSPSELLHYLRLGGLTLALILLASILSLGVAVERWMALWNVSAESRALGDVIGRHLLRGDLASARGAAERSPALIADLFRVAFERLEHTKGVTPALEAAVERERLQLGLRLKKNLWVLGTVGATTPFVGLFGTVAGIMRSFRDLGLDVSAGGTGGSAAVMTGISEALVSTAAGILVAVLAVVLYNYFQARIARINVEVRLLSEEFVETLRERPTMPLALQSAEPASPAASEAS
ncbi:MAG TPA: MotA/TolQ/ExbB proton channel family protein [Myxococcaceae bacterium]|nr:MotA/TolQ/ExbB proton channel family protein [Myxococcaceae bacterium]